ncbi:Hypothetical predicted protein [Pelobates cultripes]|uniref:Uncharacterized protein n=1 Tax=Pelobates cultripes TaxID=61616 RepID=A0AAD1RMW0_PELCU|nr:Hypothetical predicted protein [Pelobates cultripes]
MDELDEFPSTGGLHHPSSDEDNKLSSTNGDIKVLLRNIRTMFAADLATQREEIHTVEGRVKTIEEDSRASPHDAYRWKYKTQSHNATSLCLSATWMHWRIGKGAGT